MIKKCIVITGTTCAGKSTLLHTFSDVLEETMYKLPQTTTREKRIDDIDGDFEYVPFFYKEEMITFDRFLKYGISRKAFEDYLSSDRQNAACICGADEIPLLKNKRKEFPEVKFCFILVTLAKTYQAEIHQLGQKLPIFFDAEKVEQRYKYFKDNAMRSFFSPNWRSMINIHLTQQEGIDDWTKKLCSFLGVSPDILYTALKKNIEQNNLKRMKGINYSALDILNNQNTR